MTNIMLVFLICKNEMPEIHRDVFPFSFSVEGEGV
jgi:hypothetical protein